MLKPFGGLKKIFSPKNALKPFKAVHNILKPRNPVKAVGKLFGGGSKKPPTARPQTPSAAPRTMGAGMRGGKAVERNQ